MILRCCVVVVKCSAVYSSMLNSFVYLEIRGVNHVEFADDLNYRDERDRDGRACVTHLQHQISIISL